MMRRLVRIKLRIKGAQSRPLPLKSKAIEKRAKVNDTAMKLGTSNFWMRRKKVQSLFHDVVIPKKARTLMNPRANILNPKSPGTKSLSRKLISGSL